MRTAKDETTLSKPHGLIVNPKKFRLGVSGLIIFFIVLVLGFTPILDGQTVLLRADNLFNRLAKNSADYIPDGEKKADKFIGQAIDISITPREFAEDVKISQLVTRNGQKSKIISDGRIRITGDLGLIAKAAAVDARLAFENKNQQLKDKYGIKSEEVIYSWWIIFDGLTRRYIQENNAGVADFTKYIASKVLEPSYNFRNIEAARSNDVVIPIVLLLLFYILYTIWYGFSIMYLFEGFGISATKSIKKEES